jgi:hypothetical protein
MIGGYLLVLTNSTICKTYITTHNGQNHTTFGVLREKNIVTC